VLSGVLEIIPLVGPIIAAAMAGTVTFATHGTDTTIVVLIVYLVVRQIEDQVVMPLVIGRAVHLHPVITIFAVLVGLSTWGVLGGLLGVPVAAALNVTLHELYPEETGGDAETTVVRVQADRVLPRSTLRFGRGRDRPDATMATRARPAQPATDPEPAPAPTLPADPEQPADTEASADAANDRP
jgi:hypothetical protein